MPEVIEILYHLNVHYQLVPEIFLHYGKSTSLGWVGGNQQKDLQEGNEEM